MAEARFRYKRIKLESASESSSDISDTESVYSFQGRETECARDTSDTSDNFEFEVPAIQDSHNYILSSTDESELQDIAELGAVVATLAYEDNNLDIAVQADTSEENSTSPTSNSDVDPELPRSDYLDFQYCLICKTEDKDISYPYCPKCFIKKKSFFPPRPEKKKRKAKRDTIKEITHKNVMSSSLSDVDRLKSCTSSGSKLSSQESSYDESSYNSSQDKSLCETCFVKKMSGVFVHGSSGHMHSCFSCAKKTWKSIGVCPLCRKKCQNVIKLYTSLDVK
ncbi:UNVERIFIED_CONTAM: hypothetical protein PYX00_000694 [Menopon gallinae]|uniref:E3 ubiquitin-protein ligase Mdm2-like n=1 Tax=Menopon gallinae TaxID=328185 RepID=A0AAW2IBD3_9NEOP